jgi:copper chaperone CopZ
MKKMLVLIVMAVLCLQLPAQFSKATLQATGLTCAMCNNAINKALQKISFVETVRSDIKNSAFNIVFKQDAAISIDELKNAVEDAGFSVGKLTLTGNFTAISIAPDLHVKIGNEVFLFLETGSQTLEGEKTITVVDKGYVSAKQFKKVSASSKMSCVQTGKAGDCCTKDGISAGTRVYHVTI